MNWIKTTSLLVGVSLVFDGSVAPLLRADELVGPSKAECAFTNDPDAYLEKGRKIRDDVFERAKAFRSKAGQESASVASAQEIPRRGFIDDAIFSRLQQANVPAARLTTDEEFVRRVYLDLTGRIPTPAQVREFVGSTAGDKRDALIDRLLYSSEFTTKWSMWLGDLLGNIPTPSNFNLRPNIDGRNTFYDWIWKSMALDKPLTQVAREVLTGSTPGTGSPARPAITGSEATNYRHEFGASNWMVLATVPMGPNQDTFDMMFSKAATQFLGMQHYDCLVCHSGPGHLDQLSLWGGRASRTEAQRMAAFFSRTRWQRINLPANNADPFYQTVGPEIRQLMDASFIWDIAAGQYDLNTTSGNRPLRQPIGTGAARVTNFTPMYRETDATPANGQNWRAAFAENLVKDRMFARNFANRLWKAVFNLGLVDPVDSLDPARLDPKNPPRAPWSFQATHPELLEKLADELAARNFSIREFLRVLVSSSAYQLSSKYDGEWKLEYVPLFARHYPRRLDAEEIHDAIVVASGLMPRYEFTGINPPEPTWSAMQFPDPVSAFARTSGAQPASVNFLNAFLRGNRDTQPRSQAGSILQQLNLMNDGFVLNRIRTTGNNASPRLVEIGRLTAVPATVDEMFLNYLGRLPSDSERSAAVGHFQTLGTTPAARNIAIEDLAWSLMNKTDFLFSY